MKRRSSVFAGSSKQVQLALGCPSIENSFEFVSRNALETNGQSQVLTVLLPQTTTWPYFSAHFFQIQEISITQSTIRRLFQFSGRSVDSNPRLRSVSELAIGLIVLVKVNETIEVGSDNRYSREILHHPGNRLPSAEARNFRGTN